MQVLAEQLSDNDVPVFVSDVKGDASGFCIAGEESERNVFAPFKPHEIESNYWSAGSRFVPMRFSLSEIGSVLLSRLLLLNPTQESHLSIAFSFAEKNGRILNTISDLLNIFDEMVVKKERGMSKSSISVIERKILSLSNSGLDVLFGKPSVDLKDLSGLNVLNLSDMRSNFSISIMPAFLLYKLFRELPECGEVEVPKFVVFFDEAHYLFKDSNKSLNDLIITILRQIRSKGVSVFFITQEVSDIPEEILGQLSTKIIFSQKTFTEKGERRLRALARSFPGADESIVEKLKTIGPGTAIFSTPDEGGSQSVAKKIRVFAPATTMKIVDDDTLLKNTDSNLLSKYSKISIQRQSKPASSPNQPSPIKTSVLSKPAKIQNKPEKRDPSVLDKLLEALIKILSFFLKAGGIIVTSLLFNPGKKFFKYLIKKPVRIFWFLLLVLVLYVVLVNWSTIADLLEKLKFN